MHVAGHVEICVPNQCLFIPHNLELAGFKTKATQTN